MPPLGDSLSQSQHSVHHCAQFSQGEIKHIKHFFRKTSIFKRLCQMLLLLFLYFSRAMLLFRRFLLLVALYCCCY